MKNMKKGRLFAQTVAVMLALVLALPVVAVAEERTYGVTINGTVYTFDPAPQNIGGRIMLPFRAIGEALVMTVRHESGVVYLSYPYRYPGIEVSHVLRTEEITVNGVTYTFEGMASVVQDGRTLMSVRMLAEAIGANINWDRDTRTAHIAIWLNDPEPLPPEIEDEPGAPDENDEADEIEDDNGNITDDADLDDIVSDFDDFDFSILEDIDIETLNEWFAAMDTIDIDRLIEFITANPDILRQPD